MSDISNLLVKDTYNYVLQSDIVTGVVYRIGGATLVNPIFSSGATFLQSLRYSDGTEQSGYVLTSDASGNAFWSPVSGTSTGDYLYLSGGTVSGLTIFQSGLTTNSITATTISATTYENLPIDVFVTGGTYSAGTATFINNTGGTFTIVDFYTGGTNYVQSIDTISFTVDTGGSAPISSGLKSFIYLPYSGTILSWTILTNISGSTEIDLYKSQYNNYPPNSGDTIITTNRPYLSNEIKNQSTNLSGWTTSFNEDDIIGMYVVSAQTITRLQLILKIQK